MSEKKDNKGEAHKIREPKKVDKVLIASYGESYSNKALKKIKNIIEKEHLEKIIVLKIIEKAPTKEVVEATVGIEEKQDFLDSVITEKKQHADELAENLIRLTDSLDIPTEVHLRRGEMISEEIIEEFNKLEIDHLIIHAHKETMLEKLLEEDIIGKIKRELRPKKITTL